MIMIKPIDRKKLKRLVIPHDFYDPLVLANALVKLPKGTTIVGMWEDFAYNSCGFMIHNDKFDVVCEGCIIPMICIEVVTLEDGQKDYRLHF